jgi:hypothetical protein
MIIAVIVSERPWAPSPTITAPATAPSSSSHGASVTRGSLWIVPDLWKTLEPSPAPKSAFPTRSLDAQNASTRSTGVLMHVMKRKRTKAVR